MFLNHYSEPLGKQCLLRRRFLSCMFRMLIQLLWKTEVSNLHTDYGKTRNPYRLFPISYFMYVLINT